MIVALAGRRVDAADADEPRFPLANVGLVRERVEALLRGRGARALVSSAACGADLVAQQVARALGLRGTVVLPFAPALFRERSVTDRPGDWGPLYDQIIADAQRENALLVLNEPDNEWAERRAYALTNQTIVDRALAFARADGSESLAVVVWNGVARDHGDVTAHFRATAEERGMDVEEVATQ